MISMNTTTTQKEIKTSLNLVIDEMKKAEDGNYSIGILLSKNGIYSVHSDISSAIPYAVEQYDYDGAVDHDYDEDYTRADFIAEIFNFRQSIRSERIADEDEE